MNRPSSLKVNGWTSHEVADHDKRRFADTQIFLVLYPEVILAGCCCLERM